MGRSATRARRALAVATAAVSLLAGGCSAYRDVGPATVATPPSPVRVYFAEPRQLPIVAADGDTTTLDGVSEITGDLVGVSGDTVAVLVRTLNRGGAISGATVRFARRPADRVESRQPDAGGTIIVVLGLGLLIVMAIGMNSLSGGIGY